MSGPVPSPSMNGMIGSSGTTSRPLLREIDVLIKALLGQVTCGSAEDFRDFCGKLCGKRLVFTPLSRGVSNVLAVCTTSGRPDSVRRAVCKTHGLYLQNRRRVERCV